MDIKLISIATEKVMKKSMMMFGSILMALTVVMSSVVFAQETLDFSWGTVVEVSSERIVLEEYNYETEGYVNVSYTLSKDVTIENAASLTDVLPGQEVEVGFIVQDKEKIVKTLYVEKDASVETEEEG
jgi:hypothetical protein